MAVKFWTVQTNEVVRILNDTGFYQPDFSKSDYLKQIPEQAELYYTLLTAFNIENYANLPGLIFAFMGVDANGKDIRSIPDSETFYQFIQQHQRSVSSLWKNLRAKDTVILELACEMNFNPFFIDINDYQFIMPPVIETPHHSMSDYFKIRRHFFRGEIAPSNYPSYVIQAHLPNISIDNVLNVWNMFDLID